MSLSIECIRRTLDVRGQILRGPRQLQRLFGARKSPFKKHSCLTMTTTQQLNLTMSRPGGLNCSFPYEDYFDSRVFGQYI